MGLQMPRAGQGTEEQVIMSTFYSWIGNALREEKKISKSFTKTRPDHRGEVKGRLRRSIMNSP
jgi:hypothetical protein